MEGALRESHFSSFHFGSGVKTSILTSGELLLVTAQGVLLCPPEAAAMWIALRVHDGNIRVAADRLAEAWEESSLIVRAELATWTEKWIMIGALFPEP